MKPIGVVIAHRNDTQYISRCVASLDKQEEVKSPVIVDDASDGKELWKLQEVARGVPIVPLPKHRGLGLARNVGVAYLNTEWFLPLDADDWLCDNTLQLLQEAVGSNPEAGMIYGDYYEHTGGKDTLVETRQWNLPNMRNNNPACYCVLWKSESFWRVGGYSDQLMAEDWELLARAMAADIKVVKINDPIFHHFWRATGKWEKDKKAIGVDVLRQNLKERVPEIFG